jgi:REP element-mobilizing transposase RayT
MDERNLPQRKHLAHPPSVERDNRPVILFVTLTVQPRGNFLALEKFHAAFRGACGDADAWLVGRYVIMPDHVHLFCAPGRFPAVPVRQWGRYFKRCVTMRLAGAARGDTRPPVPVPGDGCGSEAVPWRWQADFWDTQMRDGDQYHRKWLYVRENPVRAGLVADADAWPFQGEVHSLWW